MPRKPKRKMGRPSKFTPEIVEQILSTVRAGNYLETAAAAAGINQDTLRDWMRRGARAGKGKFHDFSEAVRKAQASATARDVAVIGKAATEQWQAAAWRLERKFPAQWGRSAPRETAADATAKERLATLQEERLRAEIEFLKARTKAVQGEGLESRPMLVSVPDLGLEPIESEAVPADLKTVK